MAEQVATGPDPSGLPAEVRGQFPILSRTVRGERPLVYLDSAATTQRPEPVIRAMVDYTNQVNAAAHRGAHQLAEESTEAFEHARVQVARFLKCEAHEVVWTSGATAAINLVATAIGYASAGAGERVGANAGAGYGDAEVGEGFHADSRYRLRPGDEVVVTEAEHHSNLVPWQQLAARTGARLRWFGVDDAGRVSLDNLDQLVNPRTKVVAITHVSNVTGAITPLAPIVDAARAVGAVTVLDACQSAAHLPLDMHRLGVDFLALSGHKMFGPTGVGVLCGRDGALAGLPPASFGGSMVETVTMDSATFLPPPARFEAGTQMVTQAIGLGAAANWLEHLGWARVSAHEHTLARELLRIQEIPGVRIIGPTGLRDRVALVSFTVDGVHPHDVGQVLDDAGIAVRVGLHCAQPIHQRLGATASVRASATVYNTVAEVRAFRGALATVRPFFGL